MVNLNFVSRKGTKLRQSEKIGFKSNLIESPSQIYGMGSSKQKYSRGSQVGQFAQMEFNDPYQT